LQFGKTKALRIQDIVVYDIIKANDWERPIYFAATCSPDAKIGLDEYMLFKGLAWELVPAKVQKTEYGVDNVALEVNLFNEPADFSKTPQYGYKFRELANPKVFYDENVRRIISNYRFAFQRLALYYMNAEKNKQKSLSVIERMDTLMPHSNISFGWQYAWDMAHFYAILERTDKAKEMMPEIETACLEMINQDQIKMSNYYNPISAFLDICELTKEYDRAISMLYKVEEKEPNIPGLKQKIQELEQEKKKLNTTLPEKK
jgi:hypothetical protein